MIELQVDGKVSVIVPVYKVEEYLNRCVESIASQTYKNLEIILVDDGSPDKCPQKCDEWAKKDSRILVIHKQNGGLASARNAGLKIASGQFISFIDSDDYIEPDLYQNLIPVFSNENADIVEFGYKEVFDDGSVEPHPMHSGPINKEVAVKHLLLWDGRVRSFAWNKIFRFDSIRDLWFDESLKYGEDTPFSFLAIDKCATYIQVEGCYYNYLRRTNSLTGNSFNKNKMLTLKASQIILDYCRNCRPQYCELALCSLGINSVFVLRNLLLSENWRNDFMEEYYAIKKILKGTPVSLIFKNTSFYFFVKWWIARSLPTLFEVVLRLRS